MGQSLDSSHERRKKIGRAFREHRAATSVPLTDVADFLGWSPERLTRLESGWATIRVAEAKGLLGVYGVTDRPLLDLVERTRHWWSEFSDLVDEPFETLLLLEDGATSLRTHQPSLIPGLLQSDRYSWELMTTLGDQPLELVERRARLRAARRGVLTRDRPLRLEVVIDETALLRSVGGAAVMREQFEQLVASALRPNVRLRIRRLAAGPHRATGSAFHVFEFDGADPMVVQQELLDHEHFIHGSAGVERYLRAFDHAVEGALEPEESLAFLTALAECC